MAMNNSTGRIGNGARDLSALAITDDEARQAQELVELQAGKRCGGCGRRIGIGIKFTSIDVRSDMPIMQKSACDRDDCDFAELCRDGATFMEVFEAVWVDENGLDAPASELIKPRSERKPNRSAEI